MRVLGTHQTQTVVSLFVFLVYIFYTIYNLPRQKILLNLEDLDIVLENEFLVNSNKCKIKNITPFNAEMIKYFVRKEYVSCNENRPLLTYIEKRGDVAVLKINQSAIPLYSYFYVYCCYQTVIRGYDKDDPDDYIKTSYHCKGFDNETLMETDMVKVKCKNFWHRVYENVHTTVLKSEKIRKQLKNFNATTRPLSVLFLGIDSISRINFIRMLPKTRQYMVKNKWINMKGYNKMALNTFPNLMAVFTGKNESYAFQTCNPYRVCMDKCDLIWYDFRNAGFITGYAEDETILNTFNYLKKGFNATPTDFYFRPYFMAAEELGITFIDRAGYCTGPETSGERVLNIAKDFTTTFKDDPSFGVFWTNTFSHNDISTPSMMDGKILEFFKNLDAKGVLNTTMVVFLSDHGIRFGTTRNTRTGWFEDRLPFLHIWLPEWFREKHPRILSNLQKNENRFTTPYDLFLTLQDVLVHSGRNHTVRPSSGCKTCASLFEEAMEDRNCEESGIDVLWCTCQKYVNISTSDALVMQTANFIIKEINKKLKDKKIDHKCHEFSLDSVMSSSISQKRSDFFILNGYLLLTIKTIPDATFEATVSAEEGENAKDIKFTLRGTISRLDWYRSKSSCVTDLKMYCICKSIFG